MRAEATLYGRAGLWQKTALVARLLDRLARGVKVGKVIYWQVRVCLGSEVNVKCVIYFHMISSAWDAYGFVD